MCIQFHLWFKESNINEENVSVPKTSDLGLENSGDTLTEECILCVLLDP
jgi:hypothetical protein